MLKQCLHLVPFFMIAAALAQASTPAENIKPYHIEKDPQIIVEPDQTDVFAIPLDEDAEDEQMELYDLEHPKK